MFCKNCGTNNEPGVAFCLNCGAQMESVQGNNQRPDMPAAPVAVMPGIMTPDEGSKFVRALKRTAQSPLMISATVTTLLGCICALVSAICLFMLNGSMIYNLEYNDDIISLARTVLAIISAGSFVFNLITVIGLFHAVMQGNPRKPVFSTLGLNLIKGVQIANAVVCVSAPFVLWIMSAMSGGGYERRISETASMFNALLFMLAVSSVISLVYIFAFSALNDCKKSATYGKKPKPVSKFLIAGCFAMMFVHIFISFISIQFYSNAYNEYQLFDRHQYAQRYSSAYDYEYGYYYDDYYDSYDYEYGYYYDDYYDSYDYEYGYYYDDYYYDYDYGYSPSRSFMPTQNVEKAYEDAYGVFNVLVVCAMLQTLFSVMSGVLFGITAWTYNKKLKSITEEAYSVSMYRV